MYSLIDTKTVYEQIPIAEEDRCKTALICHCRLFKFQSGCYGLCNMSGIFQQVMEKALSPMLSKINEPTSVHIFVDDILVALSTWKIT